MKRYNYDPDLTNRLIDQALLAFMALAFWYLMTSCSPVVSLSSRDATATATGTAEGFTGSPLPSPSSTPQVCTIETGYDAGRVNLRSGPGTSHAVIRVLSESDVLTILTPGDWLNVETSQHVKGWVNSKFCKE